MIENKSLTANKLLLSSTFWVWVVCIVGVIIRLSMVLLYQAVGFSDTPSYRRLAETVLRGFANYDGTRTPGYPVFLALVGSDQRVWLVQLLLGFSTTLLLFYMGWKLTDRPWIGGLIALSHTLNLGQLFFESNLLTESLTTFLLVLTLAGGLIWLLYPKNRSLWLAFAVGLTSTLTLLVRPLFIYLPFFVLIFLLIVLRLNYSNENANDEVEKKATQQPSVKNQPHWQYGIAFFLPVVILLGGWLTFIHARYGDWSLTTMTGYHLIQHTGSYFEYVPDEYASLRDTYIQYRDAHIAQYGTQTNTIWEAIPELSRVSGYNFYDLSRVLARISIQLVLKHPILYIKSAISGWWMFWRTAVYWSADALRVPGLAGGVGIVIQIQRGILFFINLVFIFSSLYYTLTEFLATLRHRQYRDRLRFSVPAQQAYSWLLLVIIWSASILQTLLDHGDNPRFLIPLQSLVVLWVALYFYHLTNKKRALIHHAPQSG
ncbi:MAG: hypothetical protein A2Y53_06850 [Chloroflexi bacterium RBG_16_47_49]|nr:MAG: hypothetical protein A2Y53_06850 [Chloroflexi bacterium RBG_16_47_49]